MIIWQALGSIFLILAVTFKLGSSNSTGDNVKHFSPAKAKEMVSETSDLEENVVSTDPTSFRPKVSTSPLASSTSADVNTTDLISVPPQVPTSPLADSTSGDVNTNELISVPPLPPKIPAPPLTDSDDSPETPLQPPTSPAKIPEPTSVLSLLIFGIFSLARKYQD